MTAWPCIAIQEPTITGRSSTRPFILIISSSARPITNQYGPIGPFLLCSPGDPVDHAPYDLPANYLTIPKEADDPTDFVYRYANCARNTDNALRAFFAQLEEAGLLEDTLIAVYGDHHAMTLTNQAQMVSMTRWLGWAPDYDTMMNIPLILKVPGLEDNIIRDNTGSQVDLYPTVLKLFGWDCQQVPTFAIDHLGPAEEVDRNVVFPQTYLVKGSFITRPAL